MKRLLYCLLLLVSLPVRADVFVLGSSYSSDAIPAALDDAPQWHLGCGWSLQMIRDLPFVPCTSSSTPWGLAFFTTAFDFISFQPIPDTGLLQQSDVDNIAFWLSLQPGAVAVLHPTWPVPEGWESVFHAPNDHVLSNRSGAYHWNLAANVSLADPGRLVLTDRINEMFDRIYHDIEAGVSPISDFEQLFRDASGHLSDDYGKYVAHNALRQAFGQPTGFDNTPLGIADPVIRDYLDSVVEAYPAPEPGLLPMLCAGILLTRYLARRSCR